MFDIGLTEIIMIFVVALVVVGPERLPRVARTAGLWVGRMRGLMASVKADIDRELAAEELRKALAKQASVPEIEELIDEVSGKPLQPSGEDPLEEEAADVKKDPNIVAEPAGDEHRQ
jgi:sec-independent protein translocase protein TatB